jgi:hypothetical protein
MADALASALNGGVGSVDLTEIARKELAGFQLHKQRYLLTHMEPVKPEPWTFRSLGFMFIALVLQSGMSVILASMRTAEMFYMALAGAALDYGNLDPGGSTEAAAALFAIEFGLVLYAIAKEQRRYDREIHGEALSKGWFDRYIAEHPNFWMNLATLVMFLISVSAGFGKSLSLIDNIDPIILKFFQWVLAVSLGAGASIVAYVSGEVLGDTIVRTQRSAAAALATYKAADEEFQADLLSTWECSHEYQLIHADVDTAAAIARERKKNALASVRSVRKNSGRMNTRRTGKRSNLVRREPVKKTAVFSFIERVVAEEKRIPEVKEVREGCGVSVAKSTTSEYITEWRKLNPEIVERIEVNNG